MPPGYPHIWLKTQVFKQALLEFRDSDSTIYFDEMDRQSRLKGFVLSNEASNFLIELPDESAAEMLVGVGSVINFNIAANRRNTGIVFADLSVDVVLANRNLWRTLILASETPVDFLLNVSALDLPANSSIERVFEAFVKGEKPAPARIQGLLVKLESMVASGIISDVAMMYTIVALADDMAQVVSPLARLLRQVAGGPEILPFEWGPFYDASSASNLAGGLQLLYDRKAIKLMLEKHRLPVPDNLDDYIDQISFLDNERYALIRNIFLQSRDFYLLGDIRSEETWQSIGEHFRRNQLKLTDIYLSNVRTLLEKHGDWENRSFLDVVVRNIQGSEPFVYESIGDGSDAFLFSTSRICRSVTPCQEIRMASSKPAPFCPLH